MDARTRDAFARRMASYYASHPNGDYPTGALAPEFRRNADDPADPRSRGRWNVHTLPDGRMNAARFAGGLGAGVYATYRGLGEAGGLTSLVTDFRVL